VGLAAADLGLRILAPDRLRAPDALSAVLDLGPAVAILADYGQLVPGPLLDLPQGALNLHPSLLPRHRGATPIPATILAGDHETGVTLFRMDAGLDTGPIVAVRTVGVDPDEDGPTLLDRLAGVAAELVADRLGPWLTGEIEPRPQPDTGASLTRPLRRADGWLDPGRPAAVLERAVRALAGWPGSFVEVDGRRLIILRAAVGPDEPGDRPGTIVADGGGLALATADGRLRWIEVQPAGRGPMTAAAHRRGHPTIVGRTVGSPAVVPESRP
jgi:methionyl-tRNA formyltransferase